MCHQVAQHLQTASKLRQATTVRRNFSWCPRNWHVKRELGQACWGSWWWPAPLLTTSDAGTTRGNMSLASLPSSQAKPSLLQQAWLSADTLQRNLVKA